MVLDLEIHVLGGQIMILLMILVSSLACIIVQIFQKNYALSEGVCSGSQQEMSMKSFIKY